MIVLVYFLLLREIYKEKTFISHSQEADKSKSMAPTSDAGHPMAEGQKAEANM